MGHDNQFINEKGIDSGGTPEFSVDTTKSSSKTRSEASIRQHRAENYRLKNVAEEVLRNHAIHQDKKLQYPDDFHRTIKCLRRTVSGSGVNVHKSIKHGKAFYSGLMRCGSVWSCPVCAEKIQIRRAEEVAKMFQWAYETGHKVVMLTLTWPHTKTDDLAEMMAKHKKALTLLRGGGGWVEFKKQYGYIGFIRSLEITYGYNGWHPHTHEILIVDKDADAVSMKQDILKRWEHCCLQVGLLVESKINDFRENAVDLVDNAQSSDYITKQNAKQKNEYDKYHWGADKEVAKASTKKGRKSSKTPFEILALAESKPFYAKLFVTYSLALRGKQQLLWSKKLKTLVGLDDKTDQELVEEQTDQADILATLTKDQWKIVLANNARAEILSIAETKGFSGLQEWFADFGLSLDNPTDCLFDQTSVAGSSD